MQTSLIHFHPSDHSWRSTLFFLNSTVITATCNAVKALNLPLALIFPFVSSLLGAFSPTAHATEAELIDSLSLSDASALTQMDTLYESQAQVQTVESSLEKAAFVRALEGKVVGENRLLFEVRFDHPPVMDRASFCLYLDLDNNPNTGRTDEGAKGVDLMAAIDETQMMQPYLQFRTPVWDGPRLYITIETPLPNSRSAIRTYFLSGRDKGASNSGTPANVIMETNPSQTKLPQLP